MGRFHLYRSPLQPLLKRMTLIESLLLLAVLITATIESAVWESNPCHSMAHAVCRESNWPHIVGALTLILTVTHILTACVCIERTYIGRSAHPASDSWRDIIKFTFGLPAAAVIAGLAWILFLLPVITPALKLLIRRIEYISY